MTAAIPAQRADRTQLQQIVAGVTDGVVLLEPDRRIAWANETALALHGVRTLSELGGTAEGYRGRFALTYRDRQPVPAKDYPMERLLAGESFDGLIVEVSRVGTPRHWVHQIRAMVLTDSEGRPDCLVMIINDETERFNAEERFERAFGANPAPAVIVRLSDMRFVKVNHGFLQMTGHLRDGVIGHSMHEIDVLKGAERRDLAVARLHAGETIPQMEGCLDLPDGTEKTVLLGGQPIEIGDEACMLFTFADLHPRQLAQHALRQSEERFSKAFHMAPGPMAILTLEGLRILDVNTAFTAATGWRREEVVGRGQAELEVWGQGAVREELEHQLRQTGHLRSVEVRLASKEHGVGDFLMSAETVEIHGQRCVLSVMLDITERKQTETQLLSAIEAVMQDTSWLGQKIVEKLASITKGGRPSKTPEVAALPERAREVLGLVAQGLSDDEIASRLGITRNTVRNHVSVIYDKIGLRRRSAVIVWARERGLGTGSKPQKTLRKTTSKKRTSEKRPAS
jgi:PAS domain S-box-containing protein